MTALLWVVLATPAWAQRGGRNYVIGFYNLENLFDTYHDEGKNDYEYLPDGANQWTEVKYAKKLHNMASVIRAMKEDNKVWHSVLGVCEIENRHVLEDLVVQPEIAEADFQIVHFDGPDRRGVDVALLYRILNTLKRLKVKRQIRKTLNGSLIYLNTILFLALLSLLKILENYVIFVDTVINLFVIVLLKKTVFKTL